MAVERINLPERLLKGMSQHARDYYAGKIDRDEYLRRARAYWAKHGQAYVDGATYPQELFDKGALVEKNDKVAVVFIEQEVQDPNKPGRTKTSWVMHPEYVRFLEEERMKGDSDARFSATADHVAEEYQEQIDGYNAKYGQGDDGEDDEITGDLEPPELEF